jgi:hypothetical protein
MSGMPSAGTVFGTGHRAVPQRNLHDAQQGTAAHIFTTLLGAGLCHTPTCMLHQETEQQRLCGSPAGTYRMSLFAECSTLRGGVMRCSTQHRTRAWA